MDHAPSLLDLTEPPAPATADVPREPFTHPAEDFLAEPDPADDELGPREGDPDRRSGGPTQPGEEPPDAAPALPDPDPALNDYIALAARLYASGAAQAFLERRLQLQRTHGAMSRTDLARGPAAIAADLAERAAALRDGLPLRGPLTASAVQAANARLATTGALALALFDALAAVVPAAELEGER